MKAISKLMENWKNKRKNEIEIQENKTKEN